MIFERGEIVFAPFKFTDIDVYRLRPVLVLSRSEIYGTTDQIIAAMITSARRSTWSLDVEIDQWREAGLTVPCLVRMKLFTIDVSAVRNRIGTVESSTLRQVSSNLSSLLI